MFTPCAIVPEVSDTWSIWGMTVDTESSNCICSLPSRETTGTTFCRDVPGRSTWKLKKKYDGKVKFYSTCVIQCIQHILTAHQFYKKWPVVYLMRTDCHRGFTSTSFIYTLEFLWKKKIKFPYLLNITHWVTLKNMFVSHTRPSISPMRFFFFKIDCVHSQIWFLQSRPTDFVHLKV